MIYGIKCSDSGLDVPLSDKAFKSGLIGADLRQLQIYSAAAVCSFHQI